MMLTLDTNLKAGNATSQYMDFDFNSMVTFNGRQLAAGDDGIHEIGAAPSNNGINIDAYFEPVVSDMGTVHPKRMRYLYVGMKAGGNLEATITVDDSFTQTSVLRGSAMQPVRARVAVSRKLWGSYWRYQVRNINGADFSIDGMSGLFLFRNYGISSRP